MQSSPTTFPGRVRRSSAVTTSVHAATFIVLLVLGACRDPKVAMYSVPKEKAAPSDAIHAAVKGMPSGSGNSATPAGDGMSGQTVPTAAGLSLAWTAPASWQSKQGSSMRKATYAVVGEGGATADLAVTAFPGDVGGEIANVNRWRGQVGLASLTDAEAAAAVQRLDANGLKIGVVDIPDGSGGSRLLGAWVPYDGATWFFKLLGPEAVVAKEKPAFLEFLQTIKPAVAPKS